MEDFYEMLGVPPEAGEEEIRAAYDEKMQALNLQSKSKDAALQQKAALYSSKLVKAGKILLDAKQRAAYDAKRAQLFEKIEQRPEIADVVPDSIPTLEEKAALLKKQEEEKRMREHEAALAHQAEEQAALRAQQEEYAKILAEQRAALAEQTRMQAEERARLAELAKQQQKEKERLLVQARIQEQERQRLANERNNPSAQAQGNAQAAAAQGGSTKSPKKLIFGAAACVAALLLFLGSGNNNNSSKQQSAARTKQTAAANKSGTQAQSRPAAATAPSTQAVAKQEKPVARAVDKAEIARDWHRTYYEPLISLHAQHADYYNNWRRNDYNNIQWENKKLKGEAEKKRGYENLVASKDRLAAYTNSRLYVGEVRKLRLWLFKENQPAEMRKLFNALLRVFDAEINYYSKIANGETTPEILWDKTALALAEYENVYNEYLNRTDSPGEITLRKYNALRVGMDYFTFVRILQTEGKESNVKVINKREQTCDMEFRTGSRRVYAKFVNYRAVSFSKSGF